MPIFVGQPKRTLPKLGLVQAVCSHVVDLGIQDGTFGPKHQIVVCFELKQKMDDGRPYMQSKNFNASMNKKATLRKFLDSWLGTLTQEQQNKFDVETLIGKNAMLNLVKEEKEDNEYVNIASVAPLMEGLEPIEPVGQDAPDWIAEKAKIGKANMEAQADFAEAPAVEPVVNTTTPIEDTNNKADTLPF